ncbi:MAG: response regulator [Pseudomonadota bacterium]|nr:response regulator [Pseudomonadota bacterium]
MTILIVDDDIDQLRTLQRGLRLKGYNVLTATGVDEALAVDSRLGAAIDLVLSDYMMPGRNGVDLFYALRRRRPELPFILLTGYANTIAGTSAFWEECSGVLEKPCTLEQIVAAIEATLRRPGPSGRLGIGKYKGECRIGDAKQQ